MNKRSPSAVRTEAASGFSRFERFFSSQPALVIEWNDDHTTAKGWVAINALKGGAAGGGTRMRGGGTRDEAVFLAKTMQVKFNVCGPAIGGGKSVIDFNPASAASAEGLTPGTPAFNKRVAAIKRGVLERWFRHVRPALKTYYGTGGDVGVDERLDVIPITRRTIDLGHPQEGIVRGHFPKFSGGQFKQSIRQLTEGVLAPAKLPDLPARHAWSVADVATGWGVVCSLAAYYRRLGQSLKGKRAIVEGFGAVGGFAAYYLHHAGAKVVAISSAGGGADHKGLRVAVDQSGLDVLKLLRQRQGTSLPSPQDNPAVAEGLGGDRLFSCKADIFVPAALSHSISARTIELLEAADVQVLACGSNNPFAVPPPSPDGRVAPLTELTSHMLELGRLADARFAIIPDFVANCGMARTFHYLMRPGNPATCPAVLADIKSTMDKAVRRLVPDGTHARSGLLERAYSMYLD